MPFRGTFENESRIVHIAPGAGDPGALDRVRRVRDAVRRAFREFLAMPTAIITAFLVVAVLVEAADRATPGWLTPLRDFLKQHVFIDASTTSEVLAAVAAGIITVTSITVSVLLLAVQQSAASMSTAVYDQFLRRRENQFSFGFFIGLGLYTLITLATVHQGANPVLAATVCVLSTVVALYVLLVLLYSTVDQMRPSVVLGLIARLTMSGRAGQCELIGRTRAVATPGLPLCDRVTATSSGYVTRVDLRTLEQALTCVPAGVEVVLLVSVGSFVAYGDALAEVRGAAAPQPRTNDDQGGAALTDVVRRALRLEADRDIGGDPSYGIEQIETIGWTSISSAKSNPAPGLMAIRTLRDLLARWAARSESEKGPDSHGTRGSTDPTPTGNDVLPLVYHDDVVPRVFGAIESLGVAAFESKQHQSLAEVVRALGSLVGRLDPHERREAVGVVMRLLPSVADHVYTRALHDALANAAEQFDAAGEREVATAIRDAQRRRWPVRSVSTAS